MNPVDVIIPVYSGYHETKKCVLSAINSIDPDIGQLIVINDHSPDPELVEWLVNTSQKHEFQLLHNDINLGFVETVNRGMQLNLKNDVVLLNSDVEVANNWLSRMRNSAYLKDKIGSLTPFSNNATICSFPNFCCDNELIFGLNLKELDTHFSNLFSPNNLIQIPTGVGFCMYIRRDCLNSIGYFDAKTFGKGYGEENDWCQRAEKSGWTNYLLPSVFVFHKGGVSFNSESELRKMKALDLLSAKHPEYDAKVQRFIQQDPPRTARIKALWNLVATISKPKILMISHRLGGGVQHHIENLGRYFQNRAVILQLKPSQDINSVELSIMNSDNPLLDSLSFNTAYEYNQLIDLLNALGINRIHFHHTMGLPTRIWDLPRRLNCAYDFTVHDFYLVNGNPTLTNNKGRYVGNLSTPEMDSACFIPYPIPVSAERWRQNQQTLLDGAQRVIFPSENTYQIFSKYFDIQNPTIAWHPDYSEAQPYPAPRFKYQDKSNKKLRVLVLGALSREKGADLLEEVAKKTQVCEFHLLGYAYRKLDKNVITHGAYHLGDAKRLILDIDPDVVWYPALWPETYSYTLSLALELGLPVVVPNIGAFAERIKNRKFSAIVPWDQTYEQWSIYWCTAQKTGNLDTSQTKISNKTDNQFYEHLYLEGMNELNFKRGVLSDELLLPHYHLNTKELSRSEKMLLVLWHISQKPIFSQLLGYVPYNVKKGTKRLLSSRPIHEILNQEHH